MAADLAPFVDRSRSLPSASSSPSKRVELAAYRDHGVLLKGRAAKSMVSLCCAALALTCGLCLCLL